MTIEEMNNMTKQDRYSLLGRMQSDCEYCISIRSLNRLWGITVDSHIKYMKYLWKSFNKNEKPTLKYKEICMYERILKEIEATMLKGNNATCNMCDYQKTSLSYDGGSAYYYCSALHKSTCDNRYEKCLDECPLKKRR